MHGKRWMGAVLVLLVCALTALGIAVFNGAGKAPPPIQESKRSEGVLALRDFFRAYNDHIEFQAAGTVRGLTRRLMNEPFEVSAQVTIETDALAALGVPLKRVPAQMDIKYDLRTAGVKVSAVGLSLFEAYMKDNEASAVWLGAEPVVTELPAGNDMSGDMTLEDRIGMLVPLAPAELLDKLLEELAQSVPEACTEQQLARAYSPKDKQDVNVTLIHTVLEDDALSTAASALSAQLKKDETLYAQLQQLTTQVAAQIGKNDITLDSLLTHLINRDNDGTSVSWKVFRRDQTPIGFSVRIVTRDAQVDVICMAEFDGETSYGHTQMLLNGTEMFRADTVTQDDAGEYSARAVNAAGQTVSINGTFELIKLAENAYQLTADAVAEGLFGGAEDTAHTLIDARIDVGNGLGMIAGSPEWQGIEDIKKAD